MPTRDFDAEFDLDALMRAKEIERDPSRMARAREFAQRQQERFANLASAIPGRASFKNNAVRGSKMEPK